MTELINTISDLLRARHYIVATAESCTGGMIASAITDLAGSSAIFDRGFVTYSNEAKMDMLGVSAETLAQHGAVSAETAHEMVVGALARSRAHIALSVTGIAGPSGGTTDKPVGLVYIGIGKKGGTISVSHHIFNGNRVAVRTQACTAALNAVLKLLEQ